MKLKAIFGGTFDPVHIAHLQIALLVQKDLGVTEVTLMPNNTPPHRQKTQEPASKRLQLLSAATLAYPCLQVSDFEVVQQGISYSYMTVQSMLNKDIRPVLILGWDAFSGLNSWHESVFITKQCHFYVIKRGGEGTFSQLKQKCTDLGLSLLDSKSSAKQLSPQHGGQVKWLDYEVPGISASEIRNKIKIGAAWQEMVPEAVAQIIMKESMYGAK